MRSENVVRDLVTAGVVSTMKALISPCSFILFTVCYSQAHFDNAASLKHMVW